MRARATRYGSTCSRRRRHAERSSSPTPRSSSSDTVTSRWRFLTTATGSPEASPSRGRRSSSQPASSVASKSTKGGQMAELTNLETKLGEVLGLAMAAQGATEKVKALDEIDGDLAKALERMHKEAKQAEERATDVAGSFEGKKTAILEEAREVKKKATEMMQDYLDSDSDALDGFEFLTMAEAGEVGHWEILKTLNKRARDSGVQELVEWGIPIQQRHLEQVRQGSLKLAAEEDPNETS